MRSFRRKRTLGPPAIELNLVDHAGVRSANCCDGVRDLDRAITEAVADLNAAGTGDLTVLFLTSEQERAMRVLFDARETHGTRCDLLNLGEAVLLQDVVDATTTSEPVVASSDGRLNKQ
jgi:hypothetical protein